MHGEAKEQSEIETEKEILGIATVQAAKKNVYGKIEESELQSELDKEAGEGKTNVTDIGEEFEVIFIDSNRYYIVDKDGNVGEAQNIIKDKNPGDITTGINGEKLDGNTEETAYEIWCIEDLVAFSNMVSGSGIKLENGKPVNIETADNFNGKYVVLKTNLNFKSKKSYLNSERTDFGDINGNPNDGNTLINEMTTGTGFKPIGGTGNDGYFEGNFNGENKETKEIYKISNIYINSTGWAGLFRAVSKNAIIQNLEISGEIKGGRHAGGIVGEVNYEGYNINIENCTNRANIEGYNMVGGIVGYDYGVNSIIKKCKNYGNITITGSEWSYPGIGGILGTKSIPTGNTGGSNKIEECVNYGRVGKEDIAIYTGGIIGTINGSMEINNCSNYGEIVSNSNTGGIVGLYRIGETTSITNSSNLGELNGNNVGGIVGSCDLPSYTSIGNCYIENCYNTGKMQTTKSAGGIVGNIGGYAYKDLKVYLNNCYSIGTLLGNTIGGAVGSINNNGHGEKAQYLYVDKVYYLMTVAKKSIGKGNADEGEINAIENINTNEFLNILNSYTKEGEETYPTEWKKWKLGEKGYPVFE